MAKVVVFDHPLMHQKLSIIRNEETGTREFRELVSEIGMLMAYEVSKDFETKEVEVKTPVGIAKCKQLNKDVVLVPILRAGLGMVEGVNSLIPTAKIGHLGLYRDEETLEPHEYYCKLPTGIEEKVVMVVDPMLATGGSAVDAIKMLKKRGCKKIKLMSIIAAPEGVTKVAESHPDVEVYVSTLDRCLNENGYILPGLGDAGDRIFGTK